MFTREEFLRAWKILFDKKQIDVRGFNNMHKVLKFLDKEFDKAYDYKIQWMGWPWKINAELTNHHKT